MFQKSLKSIGDIKQDLTVFSFDIFLNISCRGMNGLALACHNDYLHLKWLLNDLFFFEKQSLKYYIFILLLLFFSFIIFLRCFSGLS